MKKKGFSYSRFKSFVLLPLSEKGIFLEVFFYLCYSRLLLKKTDFKKLAARLGKPMTETPQHLNEKDRQVVLRFGKAIKKLSNYTPFRSMCFEQALALKFTLNRRKIASTIYLGVKKEEDVLKAHAWTRVGDIYPTGSKGKESFSIISTFGSMKNT